jgi:hypothetical protein
MPMVQLDEVREVIERTERLAVRSAFALCLAFELMQRSGTKDDRAVADLDTLRGEVNRVSEALSEILAGADPRRERGDETVSMH